MLTYHIMSVLFYPTMNKLKFVGLGKPWYESKYFVFDMIVIMHIIFTGMCFYMFFYAPE